MKSELQRDPLYLKMLYDVGIMSEDRSPEAESVASGGVASNKVRRLYLRERQCHVHWGCFVVVILES